jgi:hypothetical protein
MPIWLRRYTFNEIKKYYEDENEAIEKAQNQNTAQNNKGKAPQVVTPPDFTTKKSA